MKMDNDVYFRLACRLRKETGKSIRCSYFCVAYARGDYRRALEFASGKVASSEDGRQRAQERLACLPYRYSLVEVGLRHRSDLEASAMKG